MKEILFATFAALTIPSFGFHECIVASDLKDPMEISIAPDGDLFIVEREGRVLRCHPPTGALFVIGNIPVTALRESDKNSSWAREDDILGIALDPNFSKNQRMFIYYSHASEMLNRLSRFTLKDGMIDMASEMKLLDVPTDRRDRVCHQGGSLAFDKNGLLHISTGDNTNPFESGGYAPIDDREGRDHVNAMRSAGNTNDLRGKILRIQPNETGYTIPKGNLFPPGTEKTKPEIFAMGCRNPFRMSIDAKTNTVYWGEVGPDAGNPNEKGPAGHDEVNQAKTAGNHGWPFVIANNKPYPIVDFNNGKPGAMTDPAAPKNPGKHNTGLTDLPAARSALIWYPYAKSEEFPVMGNGGRNAMAGPVFYHDAQRKYNLLDQGQDHTLITYEWMRGKAFRVKLNPDESFAKIEVMMESLMHPMDMEMTADGALYLLEYGADWYFNKNGRIRRILPDQPQAAPTIALKETSPGQFEASTNEGSEITWYITTGLKEEVVGKGPKLQLTRNDMRELRAVATNAAGHSVTARKTYDLVALPNLSLKLENSPAKVKFGQKLAFIVGGASDEKNIVVRARYIPPTGHDAGGPVFPEADEPVFILEGKSFVLRVATIN